MANNNDTKPKTFESAAERLEKVVELLDDPKTSLDDSLKLYAEGIELVRICNKMLDEAELKITVLGAESLEDKI